MFYNISLDHLKSVADKFHWISDYGEYEEEDNETDSVLITKEEYEHYQKL